MKSLNIILAITVFALTVSASFLENAKRAKFFELTDNAVPLFNITIPTEEYSDLIDSIITSNNSDGYTVEFVNFKTKNATMIFNLNGEIQNFKKVTFSLAGQSSHYYPKPAFNLKIRGKDQLFGRKQFRIRSDIRDPSMMRTKVFSDVANRLGLKNSPSTNYIKLMLNNEDLGFYVISDSLKMSYIELEYNDPESTDLIQCKKVFADLSYNTIDRCLNENDENPDMTNFGTLLKNLDAATTISDIEEYFDVENFYKNVILEWLTVSYDHLALMGHNFNVYRPPNGKWIYSLYDFDTTFGGEVGLGLFNRVPEPLLYDDPDTWFKVKFEDWLSEDFHVGQILLKSDKSIFLKYLQEVINDAFNPTLLFPRIDEVKKFISPYVKEDRTPVDGVLPGRLNTASLNWDYSYEYFELCTEFTTVQTAFYQFPGFAYGLKKFILDRFVFVCENYDIDCSIGQSYLDEYEFKSYIENYELLPDFVPFVFTDFYEPIETTTFIDDEETTTTDIFTSTTEIPTTTVSQVPTSTVVQIPTKTLTTKIPTTTVATKTSTTRTTKTKNIKSTTTITRKVIVTKTVTKTKTKYICKN